jgi:hypothetical protein
LEIPESIFEAEKLLNKNRYPPLLPTYEKGYEPERDTRPYNVIGRLVEITPLMPEPNPQNTLFTQPLPFGKTWNDYSHEDDPQDERERLGLFPQDLLKTPAKDGTNPFKDGSNVKRARVGDRDSNSRVDGGSGDDSTKIIGSKDSERKKEEGDNQITSSPENFWSQYNPVVKMTSKTIPESYVAQSSDDNATKYLGLNALKGIELRDISAPSVKKWWKAVEPYEKMYGD